MEPVRLLLVSSMLAPHSTPTLTGPLGVGQGPCLAPRLGGLSG
jgi:hypothetical protein